ncbi:MAG: hypothetical protein CMG60_09055 [Candidatus Marinimicrobia bacterium]|nr:hypothetical protein [Candidatus Neomarinimicrobiota bacterium]
MFCFKKLSIFLILLNVVFANQLAFRGKSKESLMGNSVPLAFTHMISQNYNILPSQFNPQRGSFLIIAPDGVANYLGDFVIFKKSQGFDVSVLTLSETGESAELIKLAISEFLADDPMLEYVLLIGDVDGFSAFPSFYYGPENDVTDQRYTHILGDDNIPDIFIGRLSIDSLSDLAVIMSKTINYVRDPLAYDQNWLDRGLVVAGNYSNTYPIPITPKWTSYWLRDELLLYGYNQVDTVFYPPVQQGAPYIISSIDDGVGIVNYRGWGDANGWHFPEFHVEDVNDLNNGWLTPVFFSYVCNSNDFANNVDPCLAEAVLRGGTPTVPKGGVGFVGPSDLHTSTKYNNVINAYMYDAMLNHDIIELGPAMYAGQSGLNKEFPSQNGPGEAQEFYAHVYNILGDPSLPVYLDTPDQFEIIASPLSRADGFLNISLNNLSGFPVEFAVVSVMSNGEILSKGITDSTGVFIASINLDGVEGIDVFVNKNGFIQGFKYIGAEENSSEFSIVDYNVESLLDNDNLSLGESISISIGIKNNSENTTESFTGEFVFFGTTVPQLFPVDFPELGAGQIETISLDLIPYSTTFGRSLKGQFNDQNGNKICEFSTELTTPVFDLFFENEGIPETELNPILSITNFTGSIFTDLEVIINSISEGATVSDDFGEDNLVTLLPFSSASFNSNSVINLENIAYGSDVTFLIEFVKDSFVLYSQEVEMHITPVSSSLPIAPNLYGYWAYDNTDIGFEQAPNFEWIELDPSYGGTNGDHFQLDDDDHVDISLPFSFKYHGINYQTLTVSSNGWASFVPCYIDYFWNMSIPMYLGPKALLAIFSDDLETIDSNGDGMIDTWINVFTWYDEDNGRFIIEWSRALNGYDEETEETFEIILYDQSAMPTRTGDGVIDFQYLYIEDVDVTKNYSTVGIESPEKDYGLQYVFNNVYTPGAAPLSDERAIRFTVEAPENYVAPLSVESKIYPSELSISQAYPNPFNPKTNFDLIVPNREKVKIFIVDILGREVLTLKNSSLNPGQYRLSWDGSDKFGKLVSSGTYFVITELGGDREMQKILFLK